jgi:DNA polymerase III sliding clamp (beta) subunit (PCNA family)
MEHSAIDTAAAVEARAAFTCEPKALADAAAFLAKRIIERRNLVPILSYVRIAADLTGQVTLTGSNLDQEASVTIAAVVSSPGTFCADAYLLADMAAKARKDKDCWQVRIADSGEGRAVIAARRGRFNVPTLPADDFPVISLNGPLSAFTVPAGQFIADLAALSPCISTSETKYYLRGAALQVRTMAGRDSLVLAATDGFQMGLASRPIPAGASAMPDGIVPAAAVAALIAARKLDSLSDALSVESDGTRLRFDLGAISITSKLVDGTFPDWTRVWGEDGPLAPIDAQQCLFPDLLPGAPGVMLEKLEKAAPGKVAWSPAKEGQIGSVTGDDGLLFAVLNLTDDAACGKKGFTYGSEYGQGEIVGPDGFTYPVAFSDKAISLSASHVRALIGESCFETFAVTIAAPNGKMNHVHHVLQWLWDDGASRFLTVQANGRCWSGKDAWRGEYLTRAEIEAALAGEPIASASQSEAVEPVEAIAGKEGGELSEALSEAPSANSMAVDIIVPEPGAFIIDTAAAPERAIAYYTTYKAAMAARDNLEPVESYPGEKRTTGHVWRYMVAGEYGPNDCRADLHALTLRYHTDLAAAAAPVDIEVNNPAPDPIAELTARIDRLEAALRYVRPALAPGQAVNQSELDDLDAMLAAPLPVETGAGAIPAVQVGHESVTNSCLPRRTAAHERAIRRAWEMRAKARRLQVNHKFMVQLREDQAANARASATRWKAEAERSEGEWRYERTARARSTALARRRGKDMVAMAAMLRDAHARLASTGDSEAMQARSIAEGQAAAQYLNARAAQESLLLIEARAESERLRADKAETALAAVQARADGWPPAVQRVSVRFAA